MHIYLRRVLATVFACVTIAQSVDYIYLMDTVESMRSLPPRTLLGMISCSVETLNTLLHIQ